LLYGDDAITRTRQRLRVFCNNSLRESGSNRRPMSTANGDSSLSYLGRRSASSRSSAQYGAGQGWREIVVHHRRTTLQKFCLHNSQSSQDGSTHDRPPTQRTIQVERLVDAPTIMQHPSAAPDPPQRPRELTSVRLRRTSMKTARSSLSHGWGATVVLCGCRLHPALLFQMKN